MIKIDTNFEGIFRFDNFLSIGECNSIVNYLNTKLLNNVSDHNKLPWQSNSSYHYKNIENKDLRFYIQKLRYVIAILGSNCYGMMLYPNFTDLVLWRPGMKMDVHKDTPYGKPGDIEYRPELIHRYISCVLYLNESYQGGETIVHTIRGEQYVSIPKTGSIIFFYSDDRNFHSVNEIKSGNRYTLPIWFTTDPKAIED
jgi:predicted 2-oxoglutarate/Fe(II)-dependent dioxygenase YbiX